MDITIRKLTKALELVCKYTGWEFGEVWIPNVAEMELVLGPTYFAQGDKQAENFLEGTKSYTFPFGKGLPGRVWSSKDYEWIKDVSRSRRQKFHRNVLAQDSGFKASIGVPIFVKGKITYVMDFFLKQASEPDTNLIDTFIIVARKLGEELEIDLLGTNSNLK